MFTTTEIIKCPKTVSLDDLRYFSEKMENCSSISGKIKHQIQIQFIENLLEHK